jgi:hypothetical protein
LELTNAVQLRIFRRELTATQADAALAAFDADLRSGVFSGIPTPAATYVKARQLSRTYSAKLGAWTLDIIHVAAALVLQASTFYTFDGRQRDPARLTGLSTPLPMT